MSKQTTIKKAVEFSGIGLHTGNISTIIFKPAPANSRYVFVRTDVEKQVEIPALTEYVSDLSRGTTLEKDGIKIHTVEHVLAALVGLQIDNCRIEINSNEPPVVDGSSLPYVNALLEAGIEELSEDREEFVITEAIEYKNEDKQIQIVALPTDDYRITVMIDYFNPALGSQHTGMFDLKKEFISEFAPARTFCFLTEVEMLHKEGLIKGGSLDSALVIVDREVSSENIETIKTLFKLDKEPKVGQFGSYLDETPLRFPNEPARHKLLDMIGDLALVGVSIQAQILAARPGHASNFEFAKIIRKKYLDWKEQQKYNPNLKDGYYYDVNKIMEILPHRYPFLLVDRVMNVDPIERSIKAFKNVTINEDYFNGHFPGQPVMPGVLLLEGMAQSGGLLLFSVLPREKVDGKLAMFMSIDKSKFRRPIVPGDRIVYDVKLVKERFNVYYFEAKVYVDSVLCAETNLSAALVDKNS